MKNRFSSCLFLIVLSACQAVTGLDDIDVKGSMLNDVVMQAGGPAPKHEGGAGAGGVAGSNPGAAGKPAQTPTTVTPPPTPTCEHPGAACNVMKKCGCPSGQACGFDQPADEIEIACVPPGQVNLGGVCQGLSSCVPGAACIGKDPAVCRAVCKIDADCGGNSACLTVGNFDDVGFCAEKCAKNADCATGCCFAGNQGVPYCAPEPYCPDTTSPPPPPATTLKAKGAACSANSECQSKRCFLDACHDTKTANQPCTSEFDCNNGLCAPTSPVSGSSSVCIDAPLGCLEKKVDVCYVKLSIAVCQLANKCDVDIGDFDSCIADECVSAPKNITLQECKNAESGFGRDVACPSTAP